jgi:DNA-binding transcriptional ArsR family regulator
MKKHYPHRPKPQSTKKNPTANRHQKCPDHLDRVADELVQLAESRLPNNVLRGVLTGLEQDIRQDAVLLSLARYLKQNRENPDIPKYPWHAPREIAAALKIQKRDYLKSIKRKLEALQRVSDEPDAIVDHPARLSTCEWSSSTMQTVLRKAILTALKNGRISLANAAVGLGLFIDEITVKEMAKRRGVSRSAIYQHLSRVRREVPDIINGIEVPLHELL